MKTILIVEDEVVLADILRDMLTDEGYRVLTATNGKAALERLSETVPDLVLSDVMMPVMDGPALARAMRENPRLHHVPLVLMSAAPELGIRRDGTATYSAFIAKPFEIDRLLNVIARFVL